jgi:predicted DNA-binding transcriptional regulator AlpA
VRAVFYFRPRRSPNSEGSKTIVATSKAKSLTANLYRMSGRELVAAVANQKKTHGKQLVGATRKPKKKRGPKRFLTKGEVLDKVPLSYATIWKMMRRDQFPRPRVSGTGPHAKVLWWESDIDAWMEALPEAQYKSDKRTAGTAA